MHLIFVRRDLSVLVHRHPPVGADGRPSEQVVCPVPGSYRVVIDAYPNLPGGQRNFQLFRTIRVAGAYKPEPLPAFRPSPCSTWRWASRSYHLSETTPGLYAHSAPALVMVGHWGLSFEIQPPGKQPRPPGSSSPCSLATSSGNRFT